MKAFCQFGRLAFQLIAIARFAGGKRVGKRVDAGGIRGLLRPLCEEFDRNNVLRIDSIPRWEEDLIIPPVLHDDAKISKRNGTFGDFEENSDVFQVALRQITQQILPAGFPATTVWAYGDPDDPTSFSHPARTIEVTKDKEVKVAWINELVQDPQDCRCNPANADACKYLKHAIRDENGDPVVDQTTYWANPSMECSEGEPRTDCRGTSTDPYVGPIPMVTHVHGSHVDPGSDGYPEAWCLPHRASGIGDFAKNGRFYEEPTGSLPLNSCSSGGRMEKESGGYTLNTYTNNQPTTALWYHDHSLGLTKLNVYAAGAGFWIIRDEEDRDTGIIRGTLPGPPAQHGEDPNGADRAKVREIPLVVQQKAFYCDGSLYFNEKRKNSNETNIDPKIYSTMVVNGRTWPMLEVAPVRYRFRILNAAAKGFLGPAVFKNGNMDEEELPLYIIGSDQSLLPRVAKVTTKGTAELPGDGTEPSPKDNGVPFWIGPGERYDFIVDFTGLSSGDEYMLINTNPKLDRQIIKFIVDEDLGTSDPSTHPRDLVLDFEKPGGAARLTESSKTRDLALVQTGREGCLEIGEDGMVKDVAAATKCLKEKDSPRVLGIHGSNMGKGLDPLIRTWVDPITENPKLNAVETWELWNGWVGNKGRHPIHVHQVKFLILGRRSFYPIRFGDEEEYNEDEVVMRPPEVYEAGWKDIVITRPGEVTSVIAMFDIPGHYLFHCHILPHEDYQMMRPFCVGDACGLGDTESS